MHTGRPRSKVQWDCRLNCRLKGNDFRVGLVENHIELRGEVESRRDHRIKKDGAVARVEERAGLRGELDVASRADRCMRGVVHAGVCTELLGGERIGRSQIFRRVGVERRGVREIPMRFQLDLQKLAIEQGEFEREFGHRPFPAHALCPIGRLLFQEG